MKSVKKNMCMSCGGFLQDGISGLADANVIQVVSFQPPVNTIYDSVLSPEKLRRRTVVFVSVDNRTTALNEM